MSTTTYYEFNKPEGNTLVNPLVDTNPNWDALDADLHEFNERSIANCTEIVTLGVHAISRLDTTAKFLKWIATANFTAGETFTVDGLVVAASTPAGATLATGAYVTGSVVLACLNADNTAMTVFVSGTTVASDAERLGGELPAYYAKQSDMTTAESNITNLQNKMGNTSIVGIGDGTATGAISAINADLTDIGVESTTAKIVGKDADGNDIYEKVYKGTSLSNNQIIDNTLTLSNVSHFEYAGSYTTSTEIQLIPHDATTSNTRYCVVLKVASGGLTATVNAVTGINNYYIKVRYVLAS